MPIDKTANHEKIITAARKEFLTCGFTDASMRHIAEEAGMSASGLYKHFASKEEMFSALVEPACQGLMALFRQEEKQQSTERLPVESGTERILFVSAGPRQDRQQSIREP